MGLTNEHVGPKILAKIQMYVLSRAELLFNLCYGNFAMRYPVHGIFRMAKMTKKNV